MMARCYPCAIDWRVSPCSIVNTKHWCGVWCCLIHSEDTLRIYRWISFDLLWTTSYSLFLCHSNISPKMRLKRVWWHKRMQKVNDAGTKYVIPTVGIKYLQFPCQCFFCYLIHIEIFTISEHINTFWKWCSLLYVLKGPSQKYPR